MNRLIFLCIAFCFLFPITAEERVRRIVSTSGAITEIICSLGLTDQLVGVDITSQWPPAVEKLPKVGHSHQLGSEGILALKPTHVFVMNNMRGTTLVDQLERAGVKVLKCPYPKGGVEKASELILSVSKHVGEEAKGEMLVKELKKDLAEVKKRAKEFESKPKALFVYARGIKTLFVGGTGTLAESYMESAGAVNAVKTYASYQPLSAETIIEASPDVIYAFASGVEAVGGEEKFWQLPGLSLCPAGKARRLMILEEGALNFGPRLGYFLQKSQKDMMDSMVGSN